MDMIPIFTIHIRKTAARKPQVKAVKDVDTGAEAVVKLTEAVAVKVAMQLRRRIYGGVRESGGGEGGGEGSEYEGDRWR
jgi:hypothetical protein